MKNQKGTCKWKRILAVIVSLSMTASGAGVIPAAAADGEETVQFIETGVTENGLKYGITDNNEAVITGYTGSAVEVVIPEEINAASVTVISKGAFSKCEELTKILIPGSVTAIGEDAFYYCRALTDVILSENTTEIGVGAFCYCYSLTNINMPRNLKTIGDYAFCDCIGLTSITIPEGVVSIGNNAFENCRSLTNITIPESVTEFGWRVFRKCEELTISCYEGSAAHEYAVEHGITYELISKTSYGDLNDDGRVEAFDALYVLQIVVELKESTAQQKEAADVDADGFVTAYDALLILKKVVGLFDIFPAEMK